MEQSSDRDSEVFDSIADLIIKDTFSSAISEFLKENCLKFEDSEENKLEYTAIYESYVQILEDMIETKLFEKFTQDEITHFYTNFKLNFKEYEKRNKGVVETLFGFIDFQKFRETALICKRQLLSQGGQQSTQSSNEMKSVLDKDISYFFQLEKEDLNDAKLGWQKSTEFNEASKYQVICYTRALENSDTFVIRIQGVFQNVTVEQFTRMYSIEEEDKNQMQEVIKILERDQNGIPLETYVKNKSNWLISSRDAIFRQQREPQPDGSIVINLRTVNRENIIPIPENTLRMEMWKGVRAQQQGNDLHFVDFSFADLKGYIPKSLLRLAVGLQIRKGLEEGYQRIIKYKNKNQ